MPNTFNRSQIGLIIEQIKRLCPGVEQYLPQVPVPRTGRPWEIMVGRYQLALQKCLGKPCIGTGVDPYKLDLYSVIVSFCDLGELAVFDEVKITSPPPVIISKILRAKSEYNPDEQKYAVAIGLRENTVVNRVTMTAWLDITETSYNPIFLLGVKDGECKEAKLMLLYDENLGGWLAIAQWDKPSEGGGFPTPPGGGTTLTLTPSIVQRVLTPSTATKEDVVCTACVQDVKNPSITNTMPIILDIDLEKKKATIYDADMNTIVGVDASQCPDLEQPSQIILTVGLNNAPENYLMKSGIDWIAWK